MIPFPRPHSPPDSQIYKKNLVTFSLIYINETAMQNVPLTSSGLIQGFATFDSSNNENSYVW